MMAPLPRLLVFVLGLTVLLLVINLVRKRQLQERYAILWLLAGLALTLAPVFIPWLDHLAFSIGFEYPPALLLLLAVVGLLLLIFQLSLTISRNEDRIKVLTQELALLRHAVAALQRTANEAGDSTRPAQEEPMGRPRARRTTMDEKSGPGQVTGPSGYFQGNEQDHD